MHYEDVSRVKYGVLPFKALMLPMADAVCLGAAARAAGGRAVLAGAFTLQGICSDTRDPPAHQKLRPQRKSATATLTAPFPGV